MKVSLAEMIEHYRLHGERVDEVLYQEVNKKIRRVKELEKLCEQQETQIIRYREAVTIALNYVQDGRSARANSLYRYFRSVLRGEKYES